MFFASNKVVGLDVGSSSIKIAEVDFGRNGGKLLNFGIVPTPANAINGGDITDAAALSNAIKLLCKEVRITRKFGSIGMFGTSVIVKRISIPRIDTDLVADQVRWEAEQYIPFDPGTVSLAHHVINPAGSGETMDILLIAAQNEMVKAYIKVVKGSGLKMGVLDVSAFALANLFEFNYGRAPGQTVALINIGAAITNLVVIHDGEVIFSRDMPVGGQNYTSDLHKEMGITLPEAESLKLSASAGGAVPSEVHTIISQTTEVVTEEIRNSFDFFAGSAGGLGIAQVYYTGGAAATVGLIKNVAQVTRLKFEWSNPFLRIVSGNRKLSQAYLEQIAPYCSVALGLALRKLGDS